MDFEAQNPKNHEKIDVKNVLIFHVDFFEFWLRFWSLLGFQVGAKLAILAFLGPLFGVIF